MNVAIGPQTVRIKVGQSPQRRIPAPMRVAGLTTYLGHVAAYGTLADWTYDQLGVQAA